jgi:hypothetical protein
VTKFQDALCTQYGHHWPLKWLKHITYNELDLPLPLATPTSLDLAILHGLYKYAEKAIFGRRVMFNKEHLASILSFACIGTLFRSWLATHEYAQKEMPYNISSSLRSQKAQFICLLLRNGADPNEKVVIYHPTYMSERKIAMGGIKCCIQDEEGEVKYITGEEGVHSFYRIENRIELGQASKSKDADSDSDDNAEVLTIAPQHRDLVEGHTRMSVLHFTMVLDMYFRDRTIYDEDANLLEPIRLLVDHGADVNESPLRTSWAHVYLTEQIFVPIPKSQSAIHCLIFHKSPRFNPFLRYKTGPIRSQLVKVFLENGADPNAIDSRGKTVLECAFPTAPYDVIELMLKKGAKITPWLVSESGSPKHQDESCFLDRKDASNSDKFADDESYLYSMIPAGHILDEMRWRRPECYTDEARKLARPYNPHWVEAEHVEKEKTSRGLGSILRAVLGHN